MGSPEIRSCPYVGLTPYTEEQAAYFFGREREIRLVASKLYAARLTLFYGASGVGKSSVLRAGVAHMLRQEDGVAVVVFSAWQGDPIASLRAAVAEEVARILIARGEQGKRPSSEAPSLGDCLRSAAEQAGPIMLILDQFEEYFMYHPRDDGPGSFAVEFAKVINRDDVPANFLVSIREDAYTKLDRFKGRILNLFANYVHLEHLNASAARAAITKPLEQYNREFQAQPPFEAEPALVEAIVEQVGVGKVSVGAGGAGQVSSQMQPADALRAALGEARIETPYLQLVLTRLWDEENRAGSHTLRWKTLDDLGGAESIVCSHLDAALSALSPSDQDTAARIFYHLVTPSCTKIAHTVPDLAEYTKLPQTQLTPVLEGLSQGNIRIVRRITPPPDQPQEPRYEIFHDVLAPGIVDWRRRHEEQQGKERIRQEERERREQERAEAERQRRLERAEAERQWQLERARRLRWALGVLAILLGLVAALAVVAFQQREVARSRELALSAISQVTIDPELSLLLATEAAGAMRTGQAENALRQALLASHVRTVLRDHTAEVNTAAFSPDGKWIVTASGDQTALVWEAATGKAATRLQGHTGAIKGAVFSPDGTLIATASADGTARVWEAARGTSTELRGHTDWVNSVAFSPDGKLVVTGSADGTARVWEAATGKELGHLTQGAQVFAVAFSPDGKLVATASADGTARVWEAATGKNIELRGHTGGVSSAAFSPDGKLVVTASRDTTARVWEAATGTNVAELRGHTSEVNSATFGPDGKFVVTASADGTAQVWETATGKHVAELRGHTGGVMSAAFSPDGKFVVTASADTTARIYPCEVCGSLDELLVLARHRATRSLTCQERNTYLHEDFVCPTPTPNHSPSR